MTETQRQQIDLVQYAQTVPPLDTVHQAAYFWRVFIFLADCMVYDETAHFIPLFQQLIKLSLRNTSCSTEHIYSEYNWLPLPVERHKAVYPDYFMFHPLRNLSHEFLHEFPPIWEAIFSKYHKIDIFYLFLVLWGSEPVLDDTPLLVQLFLDYYNSLEWKLDLQSFDECLGI